MELFCWSDNGIHIVFDIPFKINTRVQLFKTLLA